MYRIIVFIGLFLIPLFAQQPDGRAIMEKALNKTSWKDMTSKVELLLINERGDTRKREIDMSSRKRDNGETDMVMRFTAPADVKGTAFLIIEHKNSDDDRYLYLPAMRRTKRIASSGKGGNFMSSDFTYYDIGKPKLNDWTYKLLQDENVDGKVCFKIECLPADKDIEKDTAYGKIIRWIRKDILVTVKSQYFDRGGREWKLLTVPGIEKIGDIWFQTEMVMEDVQNKHQSKMTFKDIKINQNLPASLFNQRMLQRAR
jgi:hypothetical protein